VPKEDSAPLAHLIATTENCPDELSTTTGAQICWSVDFGENTPATEIADFLLENLVLFKPKSKIVGSKWAH
jgi:hypothetical protein